MFSTNLILAGILAAGLASADVPLFAHNDATYSLAEPVGVSTTRNLRAMPKPTAVDGTTWSPHTYQAEPHVKSTPTYQTEQTYQTEPTYQMMPNFDTAGSPSPASQCNNIGGDGGAPVENGAQLLDLDVIVSIGAESVRACCNACANTNLCIAFNFQPLLVTNVCVLARSRDGIVGGQPGSPVTSNGLLNLDAIVNL
ncbi:unnamed protein product [Peronospora effusa]|uniref:Uncharacterized protein n=1 Tax=Peronospora effusa TaxID=542832 RepID=A0A3M6VAW8_9STRA|nr:hypothetical protein DD238_008330 [Peronospora effusa]CAI5707171.1 unnamed protein product [Peronospora effusa]